MTNLATPAWWMAGNLRNVPGVLAAGEGRLAFVTDDGPVFAAPLAEVGPVSWPVVATTRMLRCAECCSSTSKDDGATVLKGYTRPIRHRCPGARMASGSGPDGGTTRSSFATGSELVKALVDSTWKGSACTAAGSGPSAGAIGATRTLARLAFSSACARSSANCCGTCTVIMASARSPGAM